MGSYRDWWLTLSIRTRYGDMTGRKLASRAHPATGPEYRKRETGCTPLPYGVVILLPNKGIPGRGGPDNV
jgi:hypothetical protein